MTRVTNFGRKRTYLEAGFGSTSSDLATPGENQAATNESGSTSTGVNNDATGSDGGPPKKKKRTRKKKPKANLTAEGDRDGADSQKKEDSGITKKALKKRRWKEMEKRKKQRRLVSSEMRRQKRIDERNADTTCFACREKGHAAKDCPSVEGRKDKSNGKNIVGICYRCGSTRHTLSRCKKAVDESNPLPFASCFVCNGKGHLASACPQNQDKGIYPNGGCCKLCGEKTHLAKDCDLRKKENVDTLAVMGTGEEAGADEDDFHTFKRHKQEVEKDANSKDVKRKMLQVKTGAQPNIVKSFSSASKPTKKVVFF